jgi:hypothetical protein
LLKRYEQRFAGIGSPKTIIVDRGSLCSVGYTLLMMKPKSKVNFRMVGAAAALACAATNASAQFSTNSVAGPPTPAGSQLSTEQPAPQQNWNFHVQNTDIIQGYPAFSAQYTHPGFHSLPTGGETRETISLDLMGGVRLWQAAEAARHRSLSQRRSVPRGHHLS